MKVSFEQQLVGLRVPYLARPWVLQVAGRPTQLQFRCDIARDVADTSNKSAAFLTYCSPHTWVRSRPSISSTLIERSSPR